MRTNDEIIKALEIIKDICVTHPNCGDCPFINDSNTECKIISTAPNFWEINSSSSWRAFK